MAKEKFVPVNGAYNITSAQVPEFTKFLRGKIQENNKFTSDGKPSKSGVITKTFIDGQLQQFRNRARKGDNSVNKFSFASHASKVKEKGLREEAKTVTTPNKTVRSNANKFIRNESGKGIQIDHKLTLARLLQGVKNIAKRDKISTAAANLKLAAAYQKVGGYGHSKDNLQKLTSQQNNLKNVQETKLDAYYKHLASKPSSSNVEATKQWNQKRIQIGKSINPNYNIKSFKSKGIKFFGTRDVIQTELPNVEVNFEELFESKIFGGMDLPFRGV
jgi:hypothetical protein